MKTFVINWHLTERCNFQCGYCYAKWDHPNAHQDIFKSPTDCKKMLWEIHQLFEQKFKPLGFEKLRLNFAGGEPLSYKRHFFQSVSLAKQYGFELSIITNGWFLADTFIDAIGDKIDLLGISLDAIDTPTNLAIGRHCKGKTLSLDDITQRIHKIRQKNPAIEIKLNTVVNAHNWQSDLSPLIERIRPQRWKILKVLPVRTADLSVSEEQFDHFVQNHRTFRPIMNVESNDTMQHSYVMIDPQGRFYQNRLNAMGYDYSESILRIGAICAFSQIDFDLAKFNARYQPISVQNVEV